MGLEFELETDHKPLEAIFKPSSKPPARIERWLLRLQSFKFKVVYRPGNQNLADPFSRLCKIDKENSFDINGESHMFRIIEQNTPKALKISQIVEESRKDNNISEAISKINNNSWQPADKNVFYPFRMELSFIGPILLRGNKIVIPESLIEQVLELAHEGHPGETVMKRRLRAKVWWPKIDRQAEQHVKNCRECILVSQPNKPSCLVRHNFPDGPWKCVAIDLLGPLPNKEMIFVIIDYYSRYQDIKFLTKTTSTVIIKYLTKLFSRLGIPQSLRADNGPQFASQEFKDFCEHNNIKLIQTTPYWPQANGEVENMNKSIIKRLQIAHSKGKNLQSEIQDFLLMYNVTPHGTTGKSPTELLFGRNIRDKIPSLYDLEIDNIDEEAKDSDIIQKQKGKEKADAARGSKFYDIGPGDKVLVENMIVPNKLCTRCNSEQFDVIDRKGNEVILLKDGKISRRQVTHLKKLNNDNTIIDQEKSTFPSPSSSSMNSSSLPIQQKDHHIGVDDQLISDKEPVGNQSENCFVTPSTPNIRDIKRRLSFSSSPKVSPLVLKKEEGMWRPTHKE